MNPVQSRQPSLVEQLRNPVGIVTSRVASLYDDAADRIEELESNERAYEEALGERTYDEVAAHIEDLEAALQMAKEFIPSPMEGCDCPSCKVFEVIDAVLQRTEP